MKILLIKIYKIKEHWQNTFFTLKYIKKICDKVLFSDIEWCSKNLSKMTSADVKGTAKQQQINYLVAVFYKFLQELGTFKTWNTMYHQVGWYPFHEESLKSVYNNHVASVCVLDWSLPLEGFCSPTPKIFVMFPQPLTFFFCCNNNFQMKKFDV